MRDLRKKKKKSAARSFLRCARLSLVRGENKGDFFSRINCIIYLIYLEKNGGARVNFGEGIVSLRRRATNAIGLAVLCDAIFFHVVVASW